MLVVSRGVREAFGNFLSIQDIPPKAQYPYQKWLRYYLDFCTKYQHDGLSPDSLDVFLKNLTEKRQSSQQKEQAQRAVQFYHRSLKQISVARTDTKFPDPKVNPPITGSDTTPSPSIEKNKRPNTSKNNNKNTQGTPYGCSWVKVFQELEGAIRIRHYSPKL